MKRPLKILVTGADGQVGRDFVDTLRREPVPGAAAGLHPFGGPVGVDEFDAVSMGRASLDISRPEVVREVFARVRPDVVVNLAAYTAVDRAEDDVETCFRVNDEAVGTLSEMAHDLGARFLTVSTDYVFDGSRGHYGVDDPPSPLGAYGASKLAGERRCGPRDTIVRTSWVMGVRGRSVIHVMADRARANQPVRFVRDQRGTVTAAADLSVALVSLVREASEGVWHVANTGVTTWYEIAAFVGRHYGLEDFATPITTAELSPAPRATRPAKSDLDTSKYDDAFGPLPAWTDAVERLLRARDEGVEQ